MIYIQLPGGEVITEETLPVGNVIRRNTRFGPMRFVRKGEAADGVPLFVVPPPSNGHYLETVWNGGELLPARASKSTLQATPDDWIDDGDLTCE